MNRSVFLVAKEFFDVEESLLSAVAFLTRDAAEAHLDEIAPAPDLEVRRLTGAGKELWYVGERGKEPTSKVSGGKVDVYVSRKAAERALKEKQEYRQGYDIVEVQLRHSVDDDESDMP